MTTKIPRERSTGDKGRPKLDIGRDRLEYFLEKGFKGADIAKMFRASEKTVYRRLQEFGIPVRASYSSMNEAELDALILNILHNFPNYGYKSMQGHLLSTKSQSPKKSKTKKNKKKGHKVQEERIREAMRRVDPEGNTGLTFNTCILIFASEFPKFNVSPLISYGCFIYCRHYCEGSPNSCHS